MVTMPGDKLWMPTLLTPPIFSSACSITTRGHTLYFWCAPQQSVILCQERSWTLLASPPVKTLLVEQAPAW